MTKNEALLATKADILVLLKECTNQKDLQRGAQLHAKVAKLGLLDRDLWIANTVINMYSKCGSLAQAHSVLEKLPARNLVSWTSLIAGYIDHGLAEEALKCFEALQHEGIHPDRVILSCSLRACRSLKAVDKAEEIQSCCERLGLLQSDITVGTMLVDIYATCGLLSKAEQVFDQLPQKDVITWTALIAGYTENGMSKEALLRFDQMQHAGVSPDAVTFICSLKACYKLKAMAKVQQLHVQIDRSGIWKKDSVIGTVLVDTYAKFGAMDKGLEVFSRLKHQDVVTWTALIEGYAQHGYGQEALKCLERMQLEGVSPNVITFICSLKACGSVGALSQGRQIHCQIERRGLLNKNAALGNALVDMYIKCNAIAKAHHVFDKLPVRGVISWTSLIAGYTEHGHGEIALGCFDQMELEGVSPNSVTFIFCLKACANIKSAGKGEKLHAQVENTGLLESDVILGNVLVDMYAACGMLAKAQEVFDKLPNQNVVSWTSLISSFAQHGYAEKALDYFRRMQRKGVYPNDVTLVTLLKICGSIGAIDKVQELHSEIDRRGFLDTDLVGNALVFAYSKCGLLAQAHAVFDMLHTRDVVAWNSLISGHTHLGDTGIAFSVYDRMLDQGLRPGSITLTNILSACNRQGLFCKSQTYLEVMSKDYGIVSTPEHISSLLDTLCRSGQFDRAVPLVGAIGNNLNVVMWHSFLGACKTFQNVDLGRWAFAHSVQLGETKAASCAVMSHINSGSNMGSEEVCQVDRLGMDATVLLLET